jgi:hypothetical protein
MTRWREFRDEEPGFAARVEAVLREHVHLTMATIRKDGAPRISGNEIRFIGDEVYLAGMVGSRRFADLRRDPRVAVHSGSLGGAGWRADAKFSGLATEVVDEAVKDAARAGGGEPPGPFEMFAIGLTEVTWVGIAPDPPERLVIETWRPGTGLLRHERA